MLSNSDAFFICIGISKPCLRLDRLAAGTCSSEKRYALFRIDRVYSQHLSIFSVYTYFQKKTQNNRGTQIKVKQLSIFVLSSHLDPIGDHNDVHHLSVLINILCIVGISFGIVPTHSVFN